MIRLATLIDTFETDFLAHYRDRLSPDHYRALAAIKQCRSQTSPMMLVQCTGCEQHKLVPHSCGHRHCPQLTSTMRVNNGWSGRSKSRCPPSTFC